MKALLDRLSANLTTDLQFIRDAVAPALLHELAIPGGRRLRLLDETQQHAGSFKYRGAALAVRNAGRGIVGWGSGNFPIAVGHAAGRLGRPALIVMPDDAPEAKQLLARQTGAELQRVSRTALQRVAREEASRRGWRLAHPFQSPEMLVGSCSLGQEIADRIETFGSPEDVVVLACGGGGLAAGVVLGLRMRGLANAVHVAEPASHPRLAVALAAGRPVDITPRGETVCDAVRATRIGDLAFEVLAGAGVMPLTASDAVVGSALALLHEVAGIRAEPSGAIALAAVLETSAPAIPQQCWVVVCGGNV